MSKHYVCVFKADPRRRDNLIDIGGDPDFSEPLPTWGICRPDVRNYVKKNCLLFFVGNYIGTNEYYIKGFFQVGEIISYKDALDRFPNRRNVIIRKSDEVLLMNNMWEESNRKKKVHKLYGDLYPDFLTKIKCSNGTYVQNPLDDHPLDNWKCKRIFRCKNEKVNDCINNNICIKDGEFSYTKGYIVSSEIWSDIGNYMIPWDQVCPKSKMQRKLKVYVYGRPRHPPMLLNDKEVSELLNNINSIITSENQKSQNQVNI